MNNLMRSFLTLSITLLVVGCGRKNHSQAEIVDIEEQNKSHDTTSIEDQPQDKDPNKNTDKVDVPATLEENSDEGVHEDDGDGELEDNQSEEDEVLADLEKLLKQTQEDEDLFKLGEEIYGWSKVLILNGYTNRLETLYLQYTSSLEIIAKRRNEAESYKAAVQAFSHASAALSASYLEYINKRIKMLDYLENEIRAKGWQGMLQDQIWNARDMKSFLESYPLGCENLIDNFLLAAHTTDNYESFQTTEVLYYNLVKSCDEKSI